MPRCPSCYRRLAEGASCPRDGSSAPMVDEQPPGAPKPEVHGYAVEELLGGGGFALVWAARRLSDGAPVALKVGRAEGNAQIARFLLEADVLRRVGPPHAPRWFDDGALEDGRPYIAMERIEGETLARRLSMLVEQPDLAWVERIAGAVLTALEALHTQGFIHRDLKPENLVLAGADRVVLLDYGLTKARKDAQMPLSWPKLTRTGVAVGTPEYMAPEQIRAEDAASAQTDLYAFGVLLFELFTLRVPFAGERGALEHAHLQRRPPRPSDLAFVPRAYEAVILSCLAKDAARRPGSASEIRRALREAMLSEESAPPSAGAQASARAPLSAPKLLGEGRHPAVILVIKRAGPAAPVVAAVKARRGHVVRQHGSRFVALFSAFDTDRPAEAAMSAARELVDAGARAWLHLDTVTIRRKDRGAPAVYGASIERPEAWMPAEPWSGLSISDELRRVLSAEIARGEASTDEAAVSVSESSSRQQSARDEEAEEEPQMKGRGDVAAAIQTSMNAAFERKTPRLVTLIGDAGIGKTRLASETAASCKGAWSGAIVIEVNAVQPGATDSFAESAAVLRALLDIPRDAHPPEGGVVMRMRAIAEALRRRALKGPVAVILDDAHQADDALLDALEYATLGGEPLPLCVVVTATPVFERVRRAWGSRTRWHDRIAIGPLSTEAAMELAAELLRPAEYPPAAVLERLSTWAGGNPFCLKEVVRTLKRAGIVRRRPNGGSCYVTTANLESLPPLPAWQWLAARWLDAMPPELAACVRLCSVLGVTFTEDEAERVQDALDRAGDASTPLDMSFALRLLVERQILQGGDSEGGLFSFRNGALQEAVYEMLEGAQRRTVHLRALEEMRARIIDAEHSSAFALERLGRHATALGERDEAAEAYLQLGDRAKSNHKDTEADWAYTLALKEASEENRRVRARALLGRGRSRYRIARVREAQDDFQSARSLAEELGDPRLHAETLLEEATALDWHREYEASAERVSAARPLIDALGASDLGVRLLAAEGRTAHRRGNTAEAIDLLARTASEASALHDDDTRVIALLLLAFRLAAAGRLDESEARFQEVIALAIEADDRPHLCVAYGNRIGLWLNRRQPERAVDDLRRAIVLAREIGNPRLERLATFNVAMLLHWSGEWTEARALVDRVQFLEERFFEKPSPAASLLLVRILMGLGELGEAAGVFERVRSMFSPAMIAESGDLWSYLMAHLALRRLGLSGEARVDGSPTWAEAVCGAANEEQAESLVEALYWQARTALDAGHLDEARRTLGESRERRSGCPLWPAQFEALERRLTLAA